MTAPLEDALPLCSCAGCNEARAFLAPVLAELRILPGRNLDALCEVIRCTEETLADKTMPAGDLAFTLKWGRIAPEIDGYRDACAIGTLMFLVDNLPPDRLDALLVAARALSRAAHAKTGN